MRIFRFVRDWIASHDRNYVALRRASRAAIVMPLLLALSMNVLHNAVLTIYAVYGAFALLLLVDFSGTMRQRLEAQLLLIVTGGVLICIGTLAAGHAWLAPIGMTIVAFVVLFSGVVSSVLARATTSLLLAFILAVSSPAGSSAMQDRLAGWGLAGFASLLAIAFLWPSPAIDPLRVAASAACTALAKRIRTELAFARKRGDATLAADHDRDVASATAAEGALSKLFLSSPYRPTALGTSARTVVRLVDEIGWLNATLDEPSRSDSEVSIAESEVESVKVAAAATLETGATLLDRTAGDPSELRTLVAALGGAIEKLEREATSKVCTGVACVDDFIKSLEPAFRAQELGFSVSLIARNIDLTAAAERRGLLERLLGRQPAGVAGTLSVAGERATSHVERHSVWLQNSIRGAVGLGLAVLAAELTGVDRAFWVIFGVLSVLRSSALNTGQSVVRALAGTMLGFGVSAVLLVIIGANSTVLWILLPCVVFLAGVAPAAISFTAGQAAFTLAIVILFNILQPVGWRVGLIRIEDVALGCGVSLIVGLLFWPRGARAALRHAIAEAYADGAAYLLAAVRLGMEKRNVALPAPPMLGDAAIRAGASARRLDDTFRNYLAERGAKPYPLADLTPLIAGVAALRLAADAVVDLWMGVESAPQRMVVAHEITGVAEAVKKWFEALAASLIAQRELPEPMARDDAARTRIIDGLRTELEGDDGASATTVRMLWTEEHIERVRELQSAIIRPLRAASAETSAVGSRNGGVGTRGRRA